ncbi:hypothetical protein TrLO_g12587 [Triparma laevis f. longispina]|uniref:Uncharacterized protein n=1 Tax=Triparma laevis f. longispina TaxID=1714387 RepID=A0A9W7DMU1_9STRA|nr:hypothetical protein TrLO_g12587 [Triparma laevis f. longispina]
MNLKVDGVEEYMSPLKTDKGRAKEVSFPQDAVIVNLTDIYGGVEIRLKSRCGLIPRVDVLVGEESVTCYNLKDEQRFEIQFESTIIDPQLLICVNDTSSNPITQYCNTYTLPFNNNLKPCLSTSWCEKGDTKTFRQFWGEMNWRYKVGVERVEGIDEAEDERVKRAKVELSGGEALEIVGWGFEMNDKRRLFALQTISGPSSYFEFRSGRASTLSKLKIREGGESDLIQWLTKGEWKKGKGAVFTEEVGGMDVAFRSSF